MLLQIEINVLTSLGNIYCVCLRMCVCVCECVHLNVSYVLSYVYSKQPIFGLTQEWFRELSFSRLECGVHDKLHISSADWWDLLFPLA